MRKRIIISNYDDIKNPYYSGGGARAIHEVAKRLTSSYVVTVVTGKYPQSKNEVIDGIYYERIGLSVPNAKVGQLLYQIALPFKLVSSQFDAWIESFTPPFSTNLLQLFTKKPVVGLVHMLAGSDMRRKYKLPFDLFEGYGLKTYKHFIVTSKSIEQKIRSKNATADIEVIANGVEALKLSKNRKKKHILYIGRIEVNQKGIDLLLAAYKKIESECKYTLVIAGTGEAKQMKLVRSELKKLSLTRKVDLVGKVEGLRKARIMEQAVCIVVPSRFETFSMVSLEALANHIPVITFDIEGLSWLPKSLRTSVKPYDTDKFAKAILEVTSNTEVPEVFVSKAENFVKKYGWGTISESYKLVFDKVLSYA